MSDLEELRPEHSGEEDTYDVPVERKLEPLQQGVSIREQAVAKRRGGMKPNQILNWLLDHDVRIEGKPIKYSTLTYWFHAAGLTATRGKKQEVALVEIEDEDDRKVEVVHHKAKQASSLAMSILDSDELSDAKKVSMLRAYFEEEP